MDGQNIPQQPAPLQPQSQISSTQAPRSKVIIIVLVGLVMLGVGLGGGYFLFGSRSEKVPNQKTQQSTETSPTIGVDPTVDTSKWVSYTNSKYGFAINYPKDWFVDDISTPNAVYFRKEMLVQDGLNEDVMKKNGYEMHIIIVENTSYTEAITHLKGIVAARPESSVQETTLLGYPSYRAVDTAFDFPGVGVGVFKDNMEYIVGYSLFSGGREEADEVLNAMLPTFKFSN